jgi:hypothetical protein
MVSSPLDDLHLLLVLTKDQCTQSMTTGVIYSRRTSSTQRLKRDAQAKTTVSDRLSGLEEVPVVGVENAGEAVPAGSQRADRGVSAGRRLKSNWRPPDRFACAMSL